MAFAVRTIPFPHAEIFCFRVFIPAYRAGLTRRKPFVDPDQLFSFFFQFVLQESGEHAPSVVMDRFAKMQRPCHRLHIQIFYADAVIRIDDFS